MMAFYFLLIYTKLIAILKWIFSENGSHVIYNLGLGFGALLGGLAGTKIINEWYKEYRRQKTIKQLREKYPMRLFKQAKGWDLARDPKNRGDIHIIDHRTEERFWIANWQTFQELAFPNPGTDTSDKDPKFEEYKDRGEIITGGKPERSL